MYCRTRQHTPTTGSTHNHYHVAMCQRNMKRVDCDETSMDTRRTPRTLDLDALDVSSHQSLCPVRARYGHPSPAARHRLIVYFAVYDSFPTFRGIRPVRVIYNVKALILINKACNAALALMSYQVAFVFPHALRTPATPFVCLSLLDWCQDTMVALTRLVLPLHVSTSCPSPHTAMDLPHSLRLLVKTG
jgi:hypothetical protein